MTATDYPQDPAGWAQAIENGLHLSPKEARGAFLNGEFPYHDLTAWIRTEFAEGFVSDFIPALLRNIRGLVAWVYGGGEEPFWPGADPQERD